MPFISDTKQQKGKLNTPVDPLTQELSFISPFPDFPDFESGVLSSFQTVFFEAAFEVAFEATAWALEANAEALEATAWAWELEAKAWVRIGVVLHSSIVH